MIEGGKEGWKEIAREKGDMSDMRQRWWLERRDGGK